MRTAAVQSVVSRLADDAEVEVCGKLETVRKRLWQTAGVVQVEARGAGAAEVCVIDVAEAVWLAGGGAGSVDRVVACRTDCAECAV